MTTDEAIKILSTGWVEDLNKLEVPKTAKCKKLQMALKIATMKRLIDNGFTYLMIQDLYGIERAYVWLLLNQHRRFTELDDALIKFAEKAAEKALPLSKITEIAINMGVRTIKFEYVQ